MIARGWCNAHYQKWYRSRIEENWPDLRHIRPTRQEYWQTNNETYKRDLEICSRWAAGESATSISKDMGISKERARQLLKGGGAKTLKQRNQVYKEWALVLYRAGMTQIEARKAMGLMGHIDMPPPPRHEICSIDGCDKKPEYVIKGLCKRHYYQSQYNTNPQRKLGLLLRARLNIALKEGRGIVSAVRRLGCTLEEFKRYIEGLWEPGMSWDNWARNGWHLDHIRPLNTFDLTDEKQRLEAIHYTNMRPLWAKPNYTRPKDGSDL